MNSTEPFNHYTTQKKESITLEATDGQKDNAKKEMLEKTVRDMVGVLAVVSAAELNTAADWDKAAAYYYGATGKSGSTIYGRAEKRCADYGTCTGQGGEAAVNTAIGQALAGKNSADIIKQLKVLYSQNVLRYANLIDQNIGAPEDLIEIIGEGQAFWRILKPWLTDADARKVFDRMFSTMYTPQAANNYNYCIAKKYIDSFLAQTSVMGTASAAATALGDLVEAAGVTCASDIVHGLVTTIPTNAGTYNLQITDNDIGAALAYSEAVKKVVNLVDGGSGTDIATAFESTSLKGLAERGGEDTADMFATHHGSANWMSAIITDATKASGSSYSTAGAKAEAIQKTIQDSIAMQSIITDLEHAGHAEHGETADQKNAYWDSAAAKYFGTTAARSSTIYARADKRGKNFGQMEAGSVSGTEVSKVNKNILAAFNSGPSEANMNTIIKNLKVIYTQATLRYAYLVNEDLAEATDWNEHQAEGFAFYNNIAPYVKAKDSDGHNMLANYFNPKVVPDSYNFFGYCKSKAVLKAADSAVWSAMGTFENDGKVTCPDTFPAEGKITTDAGSYDPDNQIGASLSFAGAIKAVTSLLDENVNYATVKSTYNAVGLRGEAGQKRTDVPYYNLAIKYFKEADWINTYIETAFDSSSTLATAARLEIIEKTARDNVAVQAVISDLYKAQATTDPDASTVHWDHAAAKYFGPDNTEDRSQTIYARANKRGANYGTLDTNPNTDGKFAKTNKVVMEEFNGATTIPSRKTAYTKIVNQIKIIYAQCVLRYAYLIDTNLGNYVEYQAEGQAFWKILAPWVNDVDENGAVYLEGIFDTARAPTHGDHFCHALEIIRKLDLRATDFGNLEGTGNIDCSGRTVPTDAAAYLATAAPVSAAPATFRAGIFASLASVAVALLLA